MYYIILGNNVLISKTHYATKYLMYLVVVIQILILLREFKGHFHPQLVSPFYFFCPFCGVAEVVNI